MTEQEQPKNDFMHKLALQIVERRNLVFLIVILGPSSPSSPAAGSRWKAT